MAQLLRTGLPHQIAPVIISLHFNLGLYVGFAPLRFGRPLPKSRILVILTLKLASFRTYDQVLYICAETRE